MSVSTAYPPRIRPGFTHPVTDYFLEDVLLFCGYKPTGAAAAASNAKGIAPPPPRPGTEQHAAMAAAIESAFLTGSDESFERILELVEQHPGTPSSVALSFIPFHCGSPATAGAGLVGHARTAAQSQPH